jgi:hypothetical protein
MTARDREGLDINSMTWRELIAHAQELTRERDAARAQIAAALDCPILVIPVLGAAHGTEYRQVVLLEDIARALTAPVTETP